MGILVLSSSTVVWCFPWELLATHWYDPRSSSFNPETWREKVQSLEQFRLFLYQSFSQRPQQSTVIKNKQTFKVVRVEVGPVLKWVTLNLSSFSMRKSLKVQSMAEVGKLDTFLFIFLNNLFFYFFLPRTEASRRSPAPAPPEAAQRSPWDQTWSRN